MFAVIQKRNKTKPKPIMTTEPESLDYSYTKFQGSHVDGSEPKEKSFDGGKTKYKEIPLLYNYGTPETPIIDQFFFELPEIKSFGGINSTIEEKPPRVEGDPPYIKESHAIMFSFDLRDPECKECLTKLDELYMGTAKALGKFKGKVNRMHFNPDAPQGAYKHPVYWKYDTATGERVPGRNPSMWVKLNHWTNNKTLFTDIEGNPIDWELLTDVEVKMYPLLHVEKIYCGSGLPSLQIKVVSAVITDIVSINTQTRQTRTIDRLKNKAGLKDSLAGQLATLRMAKQDVLASSNYQQPQNATLPSSGEMHQIPTSNSSNNQNLNDYLGGAPATNTPPQIIPNPASVAPVSSQFGAQQPNIQLQIS